MYLILRLNRSVVRLLSSFRSVEKGLMIYPWHLKEKAQDLEFRKKNQVEVDLFGYLILGSISNNCCKDRSHDT